MANKHENIKGKFAQHSVKDRNIIFYNGEFNIKASRLEHKTHYTRKIKHRNKTED